MREMSLDSCTLTSDNLRENEGSSGKDWGDSIIWGVPAAPADELPGLTGDARSTEGEVADVSPPEGLSSPSLNTKKVK